MILGVIFGKKSYPLAKYFFILTVVVGVALFMFKDKAVAAQETAFGIGEILLVFFY